MVAFEGEFGGGEALPLTSTDSLPVYTGLSTPTERRNAVVIVVEKVVVVVGAPMPHSTVAGDRMKIAPASTLFTPVEKGKSVDPGLVAT